MNETNTAVCLSIFIPKLAHRTAHSPYAFRCEQNLPAYMPNPAQMSAGRASLPRRPVEFKKRLLLKQYNSSIQNSYTALFPRYSKPVMEPLSVPIQFVSLKEHLIKSDYSYPFLYICRPCHWYLGLAPA